METSYLWTLMTASNLYYILEENKKYSSNLQHKQCIYSNLWSGVGEMFRRCYFMYCHIPHRLRTTYGRKRSLAGRLPPPWFRWGRNDLLFDYWDRDLLFDYWDRELWLNPIIKWISAVLSEGKYVYCSTLRLHDHYQGLYWTHHCYSHQETKQLSTAQGCRCPPLPPK